MKKTSRHQKQPAKEATKLRTYLLLGAEHYMAMRNKRLAGNLLATALLLLIPIVTRAPWSRFDFVLAGVILLGTVLICELVLRIVKKIEHRILICGTILAALLVIWIELAVGLFGTPFAGN